MGQGTSDASSFKGLGEGGDDGFARAACGSKQDGQLESNPVHQKVTELHGLFRQLEDALANPKVAAVGDTYRKLAAWNKDHRWDPDLQSVLEVLSQEHMCPMWRRQALEEAYRLFYDDVAIRGLEEELAQLPEPPTSEDIGFRQLPEALLSSAAARQPVYRGSFEDQNACMVYRRRWDYEIRKTGEVGHSRYMCAGDVATKVAQAVLPVESCCAARETANRARGPRPASGLCKHRCKQSCRSKAAGDTRTAEMGRWYGSAPARKVSEVSASSKRRLSGVEQTLT
eukprot:TRINITY_DN4459_c0_g1_i5.p1 TRINITY_DN4459_c0_g1~~TRINITY_DN4459_c0_g1_i5.p1  ORF type:complete len:294 (+),score=44.12 TRINITY_DN4459_c0_g1_i5:31-882(+)